MRVPYYFWDLKLKGGPKLERRPYHPLSVLMVPKSRSPKPP